MFETEFLSLVREIESSNDVNSRNVAILKLKSLIDSNKKDFVRFYENLSDEVLKNRLDVVLSKFNILGNSVSSENLSSFIDFVFDIFNKWVIQYHSCNGDFLANPNIKRETDELIDSFICKVFESDSFWVFEKVFEMKNGVEFSLFQNYLKNRLRVYLIGRIKSVLLTKKFFSLPWFKRFKFRIKIYMLINELNEYKFDFNKFKEVLDL